MEEQKTQSMEQHFQSQKQQRDFLQSSVKHRNKNSKEKINELHHEPTLKQVESDSSSENEKALGVEEEKDNSAAEEDDQTITINIGGIRHAPMSKPGPKEASPSILYEKKVMQGKRVVSTEPEPEDTDKATTTEYQQLDPTACSKHLKKKLKTKEEQLSD